MEIYLYLFIFFPARLRIHTILLYEGRATFGGSGRARTPDVSESIKIKSGQLNMKGEVYLGI